MTVTQSAIQSEIRVESGSPVLYIDGAPASGLMHWNRYPVPQDIEVFRNAGIHLFSFMGTLPMPQPDGTPGDYNDGLDQLPELNNNVIDRQIAMLEDADPQIQILIRFRITTPVWWRKGHPDDMVRVYHITDRTWTSEPHASLTSPSWRDMVQDAIRDRVRYLEKRWPHRIFGYQTGLCCCAENAYTWGNSIADFSPVQLHAFRLWLARKYPSIAAWNRAWHTRFTRFEQAEFPDPELFLARTCADSATILDPVREQNAADFMQFSSETMAEAVCMQAKCVKDTLRSLGRKKVYGAFYGYANLPLNQTDQFCAGHRAQEQVLRCPDIDFLCAPINYADRQSGGCSTPQLLPGAALLHGKLYYAEEDTRFHCAQSMPECVSGTPEQTRPLLWRNFMDAWRSGGSMWWMDLFGRGWFRDPTFTPILKQCVAFAAAHMSDRASIAQIAVLNSDASSWYEKASPTLPSALTFSAQLEEICACGAPFDLFRLEDLDELKKQNRLEQYRLVIVTNAWFVDDRTRAFIEQHLKCGGRTVLWLGPAGIISAGSMDAQNVSALTGIDLTEACSRNGNSVETWLDGGRTVYGSERNFAPRLVCLESERSAVGWYVQGVDSVRPGLSSGGAFAVKGFSGWRSVWSASAPLPANLLTRLAQTSGVHCFDLSGDQIFAGPGYLAVAAKSTGTKTILLPKAANVSDFFTGDPVAEHAAQFLLPMKRGEFRLFILSNMDK